MDLSSSVIMPREDFLELSEAAWNQPPATLKDRAIGAAQITLIFAGISGAVVAGSWGWAKAMDWLEDRNFNRRIDEKRRTSKNTE